MKNKIPKTFKMPVSGALVGSAKKNEFGKYFQLYASGSMEPRTARAIAAWLLKVAEWIEEKPKKQSLKPKVKNPQARTSVRPKRACNPRKKKSNRSSLASDIAEL